MLVYPEAPLAPGLNLSAAALRYYLLDGPVRLEPLRILASRTIEWSGRRATFYILGASHAVRLCGPHGELTELLSCLPPAGPAGCVVEAASDQPRELQCGARGVVCRTRLSRSLLRQGDDLREVFPAQNRLDLAFPGGGGRPPVTRVGWRCAGACLWVETVHTYPEEGRAVRSRTCFTAGERE